MRLVDGHSGLEVLERAECLALLAEHRVGRLAVAEGSRADIFPVNYAMDGERIVLRTAPGTKLRAAPRGEVAFEIDGTDVDARTGWSVVVHGTVDLGEDDRSRDRADTAGVDPWVEGDRPHVLTITPTTITGRRVVG